MANTVRRFESVIIGSEKFGSKLDCRSLRSARIIATWTDHEGSISGSADCYIQHTVKMGSERWQHVFALVNWYSEDENKDKYGNPVEVWKTEILPGGPARFFSKFVVASSFEGKIVLVPINCTFT